MGGGCTVVQKYSSSWSGAAALVGGAWWLTGTTMAACTATASTVTYSVTQPVRHY